MSVAHHIQGGHFFFFVVPMQNGLLNDWEWVGACRHVWHELAPIKDALNGTGTSYYAAMDAESRKCLLIYHYLAL